jgi:hypothetical protein
MKDNISEEPKDLETELTEELIEDFGEAGEGVIDYMGGPGFIERIMTSK